MISSILFLLTFYVVPIGALFVSGGKRTILDIKHSITLKDLLLIITTILACIGIVYYLISLENTVYTWDYSGYWKMSIERTNYVFNNSIISVIKSLIISINYDDYNLLLPTVVSLPLRIFGYSRVTYIVINTIMFLIPTILLQGLIVTKLYAKKGDNYGHIYAVSIVIGALSVINYRSLLNGYIDIAYLVPLAVILYIFVDYDFREIHILKNIFLGILLVIAWVCRRYVVFFLIGFVIAMIYRAVYFFLAERKREYIFHIIINFAEIGISSFILLMIFCKDFVIKALTTNYGNMYSAYRIDYFVQVMAAIMSVGIIYFTVFCYMAFQNSRKKKNTMLLVSVMTLLISECLLFWHIQNMGSQHMLITSILLFIIICSCLDEDLFSRKRRTFMIIAALLLIDFVFVYAPISIVEYSYKNFGSLDRIYRHVPNSRSDMEELGIIVSDLNELVKGTEDRWYITASSQIFNVDTLRNYNLPDSVNTIPNCAAVSEVDLRDGFPIDFFYSRYILSTDITQVHLNAGQDVIVYLNEEISKRNSAIGSHYKIIKEYKIDDGITVFLREKISEYNSHDLHIILDHYDQLYPESQELFKDRIEKEIQKL